MSPDIPRPGTEHMRGLLAFANSAFSSHFLPSSLSPLHASLAGTAASVLLLVTPQAHSRLADLLNVSTRMGQPAVSSLGASHWERPLLSQGRSQWGHGPRACCPQEVEGLWWTQHRDYWSVETKRWLVIYSYIRKSGIIPKMGRHENSGWELNLS